MNILSLTIILYFTFSLCYASKLSILVFNDVHVDLNFNITNCKNSLFYNFTKNSTFSNGIHGCDPPLELIKTMVKKMKKDNPNPDLIILPGDFVAHGYSQNLNSNYSELKFQQLKEIINSTFKEIKKEFPNVIILPTLGNNDPKFHYQTPSLNEKNEFYNFLYDVWFSNSSFINLKEIYSTFIRGGFYKVELDNDIIVLCLNTLYYTTLNKEMTDISELQDQLKWVTENLEQAKIRKKKIILSYHIFPGLNYIGNIEEFMNATNGNYFNDIFKKYSNVIKLIIASHVHLNGFRVNKIEEDQYKEVVINNVFFGLKLKKNVNNYYGNTIISGSASPIFYNNPSFLNIIIDNSDEVIIKDAIYNYFNLFDFNFYNEGNETNIDNYFFKYNLKDEYNLSDLNAESLYNLTEKFEKNDELFLKFILKTYGYPLNSHLDYKNFLKQNKYIKKLFSNFENLTFVQEEKKKYICTLRTLLMEDFNLCLKN